MKRLMTLMIALMTIVVSASAMSYTKARNEALFLTDKMAYELNLSSAQYDAVYEINLDYFLTINHPSDVLGLYWTIRNRDLGIVLSSWQYDIYRTANYFYRPVLWSNSSWRFGIYSRYSSPTRMFFPRPAIVSTYRGRRNWRSGSYYKGSSFGPAPRPSVPHKGVRPLPKPSAGGKSMASRPWQNGPQARPNMPAQMARTDKALRAGGHLAPSGHSIGDGKAPQTGKASRPSAQPHKSSGRFGGHR